MMKKEQLPSECHDIMDSYPVVLERLGKIENDFEEIKFRLDIAESTRMSHGTMLKQTVDLMGEYRSEMLDMFALHTKEEMEKYAQMHKTLEDIHETLKAIPEMNKRIDKNETHNKLNFRYIGWLAAASGAVAWFLFTNANIHNDKIIKMETQIEYVYKAVKGE